MKVYNKLEWFKKRIGKKVYRTASTCPCEVCKKVEDDEDSKQLIT
jgi:hypothetical protein